jgi:hypothetical protein
VQEKNAENLFVMRTSLKNIPRSEYNRRSPANVREVMFLGKKFFKDRL